MRVRNQRCVLWSAGSTPNVCTAPPLRSRNPSRISTVVVFPAPFGPSSAKTSPFCTSKLTSRTATVSPYDFERCSTLTAGTIPPMCSGPRNAR